MTTMAANTGILVRLEDWDERAQGIVRYWTHVQGCPTCTHDHNRYHVADLPLFNANRRGVEVFVKDTEFCPQGRVTITLMAKAYHQVFQNALKLRPPASHS